MELSEASVCYTPEQTDHKWYKSGFPRRQEQLANKKLEIFCCEANNRNFTCLQLTRAQTYNSLSPLTSISKFKKKSKRRTRISMQTLECPKGPVSESETTLTNSE